MLCKVFVQRQNNVGMYDFCFQGKYAEEKMFKIITEWKPIMIFNVRHILLLYQVSQKKHTKLIKRNLKLITSINNM